MSASAVTIVTWLAPSGDTGTFNATQGANNTLPAGSTITIKLSKPLDAGEFQVTFDSDNAIMRGFSARGYPQGSITFTLPLALSVLGMTVKATGNFGGVHTVASTMVMTVEGDLDYGQLQPGKWTVIGLQEIPVPVPSGVKTVLEFNAGAFTWATVAGVFTPGADLTGTSTQQWIDAISGSGGTGGAVPIQNNATITVGAGSTTDIDLSAAAAANGTLKALRLLAPSLDTANAGALNIGTTNVTSIQVGSAANTTGNVQTTVNAAGAVKHMVNTTVVLSQGRAATDFVAVGASLAKAVNLTATGLSFGANVVGPNINVQTMQIDAPPVSLIISGQAANNAATGANVNGGAVLIKSGGSQNNGNTGNRGQIQLQLGSQIMLEAVEVAPLQRILSLVAHGVNGLTSSNVPANGGDGVIFISNAASVPTASPVGGAVLFANAGALWIQEAGGNNFQIKTVTGLGPSPTWANDLATSVTAGPQWVANISGANGNTNVSIAPNVGLIAQAGTGGLLYGAGTGPSTMSTGNLSWAGAANKAVSLVATGGGGSITITASDVSVWRTTANKLTVSGANGLSLQNNGVEFLGIGTVGNTNVTLGVNVSLAGAAGIGALILGSMTGDSQLPTGNLSWAGAANKKVSIVGTGGGSSVTITGGDASTLSTSANGLTVSGANGLALQNGAVTYLGIGTVANGQVTVGANVTLAAAAGNTGISFGSGTGPTTLPTGAISWTGAANQAATFTSLGGGAKINIVSGDAALFQSLANGLTVDAAAALSLGPVNATSVLLGSTGAATAVSVTTTNAGFFNVSSNANLQLSLSWNLANDVLKIGSTINNQQLAVTANTLTFGQGLTQPTWSHTTKSSDTTTTATMFKAQGAFATAANNQNGGNFLIQSGPASNNGNTGIQGAIRLQLGQSTTETMIECAEPTLNQRVVALARVGAGITSTQIPANAGDGVVWVGNAQTNPTANAVAGATIWASGATLFVSKGLSVAPAGTTIWDAGTTTAGVITTGGLTQGSSAANKPFGYVASAAINVNVNIALTNVQYANPLILLTGTVPVGNCQVALPNVVGATWLFDLQGVTASATNNLIFVTGSGATPAVINTASLITSQKLVRMTITAPNVVSYG